MVSLWARKTQPFELIILYKLPHSLIHLLPNLLTTVVVNPVVTAANSARCFWFLEFFNSMQHPCCQWIRSNSLAQKAAKKLIDISTLQHISLAPWHFICICSAQLTEYVTLSHRVNYRSGKLMCAAQRCSHVGLLQGAALEYSGITIHVSVIQAWNMQNAFPSRKQCKLHGIKPDTQFAILAIKCEHIETRGAQRDSEC